MTSNALAPEFSTFARLGYVSRGVVYGLVGILALTGSVAGPKAAMHEIAQQSFGKILLGIVVLGLIAYAIWRWVQAFADPDNVGSDGKGLLKRAGRFISGFLYAALALWGLDFLFGIFGSGGGGSQDMVARVLEKDYGPLLLWAVAIGAGITGLFQIYKGWTADFDGLHIPGDKRSWAIPVCRFGVAARGVVWLVIAGLLARMAMDHDADRVGIGPALQTLQSQSHGRLMLAVIAVGFVAFGIFSLLQARYRRIDT